MTVVTTAKDFCRIDRFKDQKYLWKQGAEELVIVYKNLNLNDLADQLQEKLKSSP